MSVGSVSVALSYLAFGGYAVGLTASFFRKEQAAWYLFIAAFAVHTVSQVLRGWYIGMFFPNPIFNEVSFLPWSLALAGLIVKHYRKELAMWIVLVPVLVFGVFALFWPKGILPPFPKNQTIFSQAFFSTEVIAHACFLLGAWFALFFLFGKTDARIFHNLAVWGFVFYSIAQVTGAVWADKGWGSPFHWADRHLFSASLWCYYAAYLHLTFVGKWSVRKRAWVTMMGFILVVWFSLLYQVAEVAMTIGG